MTAPPPLVLVVSHTHWDREWYKTAEQFRVGLVSLIDDLLETPRAFLLDGQGIVLDDYLGWRPERRAALGALLTGGRLEAGPWYVLADNLIPSGEALVRNLLAGRAALGAHGASAPAVLYCPDAFGHPAAGPVLASGFGLPLAVVWRGYGGRGWPAGDSARWRAANGDEVLLYHLPSSGYELGANLPSMPDAAHARWQEIIDTLGPRSRSGLLLVLNGADHHAVQPALDAALTTARMVLPDVAIESVLLSAFPPAQRARLSRTKLAVVEGELRCSPGYVWSLQGTFGARAAQKRTNARLERLLSREVEPWTAHAWWRGVGASPAAEHALWRLVLESHPHDTLCGCAIDAVALAMDDRLRRADAGARELRNVTLGALVGCEPDETRVNFDSSDRDVLMANPVPHSRTGVVEIDVEIPLAPAPVGPGSRPAPARAAPMFSLGSPALPMQRLSTGRAFARHDARRHYPRNALVQRDRVLVWADAIPSSGTVVIPVVERRTRARAPQEVSVDAGVLSNGLLSVWLDEARGLCLRAGSIELEQALGFESAADGGDLYTPSLVPDTTRTGSIVKRRVTMRGPLRAELTLDCRVPVATRALQSATGVPIARRAASLRLRVRVQLDAGTPWCRILVEGTNTAEDQRTRIVFGTGCANRVHLADAAFGAVRRSAGAPPTLPGDVEVLPPTAPLHRYVSLFDDGRGYGMTVVSDGLAEYEAMPCGDVAVTLIRAVGELSRSDLRERRGHAGWPVPVPLAQSLGPFEASFALYIHGLDTPAWRHAIERVADDVLLPASGATVVTGTANLRTEGLTLEGEGLRLLACKRSADGRAMVARCLNTGPRAVRGELTLQGLAGARLARLDETPLGALAVSENRVRFEMAPHAVSTFLLTPLRGATS
ncbi:MAG: hypothetical protein ACT4P7_22540 [Gemmatimonadaceae bacterium]